MSLAMPVGVFTRNSNSNRKRMGKSIGMVRMKVNFINDYF